MSYLLAAKCLLSHFFRFAVGSIQLHSGVRFIEGPDGFEDRRELSAHDLLVHQ